MKVSGQIYAQGRRPVRGGSGRGGEEKVSVRPGNSIHLQIDVNKHVPNWFFIVGSILLSVCLSVCTALWVPAVPCDLAHGSTVSASIHQLLKLQASFHHGKGSRTVGYLFYDIVSTVNGYIVSTKHVTMILAYLLGVTWELE